MAGAMHKMAVYLGLVEDDRRYDDGYDSYEEEYAGVRGAGDEADRPAPPPGRRIRLAGDARGAAASPRGPAPVPGHRSHSDHDLAPAHVQ